MSTPAFDLLSQSIQHCLWRMNWTELRPIQSESIRAILQTEDDLIVSAATASGKTEAAFLPIISHIDSNRKNSVQALCISPYTSPGISPSPSDEEDSGIEDCQAEAVAYDPETFQGRTPKRRKLPAARRLRF